MEWFDLLTILAVGGVIIPEPISTVAGIVLILGRIGKVIL